LGVSWTFLAAVNVTAQMGTLLASRWWGVLSGRLGSLRLLGLGTGHLFVNLAYLWVGPSQYHFPLLAAAFVGGVLLAAWTVGSQQLLLDLAPREGRGYYTSAYNMTSGWFTAAGALLGGLLADHLPAVPWCLPSGLPFADFHVLLLAGTLLGLLSLRLVLTTAVPQPRLGPLFRLSRLRAAGRLGSVVREDTMTATKV
jgi:hypothetical protein